MNISTFLLMGLLTFSCGNTQYSKRTSNPEKKNEVMETSRQKEVSNVAEIPNTEKKEVENEINITSKTKPSEIKDDVESLTASESKIENKETAIKEPIKPRPEEIVKETSMPLPVEEKKQPKKVVQSSVHSEWNALLKKYVTDAGNVDYKSFGNEKSTLNSYIEKLGNNAPADSWSKKERLAYYINLYNAATVKLILDNYPIKSIKDINKPWGKKWVRVGNTTYSLGNIEHKILRKMNEPRIHFAINCASYSCPKLLNVAFTAANMETLLQKAINEFINDTKRNKISTNKVQLSNIFKWYKKDFTSNGTLIEYLNSYLTTKINDNADIDYLKYDWSLNEAK